jgi:hypothetical protein
MTRTLLLSLLLLVSCSHGTAPQSSAVQVPKTDTPIYHYGDILYDRYGHQCMVVMWDTMFYHPRYLLQDLDDSCDINFCDANRYYTASELKK